MLTRLNKAWAPAACWLLLLLTLLPPSASTNSKMVVRLPHLAYDSHTSVLLGNDQVWRPGTQTLITSLALGRPMIAVLNITEYQKPFVPPICYLLYKCSSQDSEYLELNVTHNNPIDKDKVYCGHSRAFTITKLESAPHLFKFNLTLDRSNKVSFEHSMSHSLELRFRVEFREGTDHSASLLVYNLDSLTKLNSRANVSSTQSITRYILSTEGAAFLASLAAPPGSTQIDTLQLLDKQFLLAVRSSPIFIRPMLSVSVMLINSGRLCEDKATVGDRILFTTGDSDPDIAQFLFNQPNYFIEIQSGVLTYSREALQSDMKNLIAKARRKIRICIRVSLNPAVWHYRLAMQVAELDIPTGAGRPGGPVAPSPLCGSYMNRTTRWLVFSLGMRDAVLMSPIVCKDRAKEVTKVSYNGKECTNYLELATHRWQSCGHYSLAQYGNAIQLQGPVGLEHAGQYTFLIQDTAFIFFVTVFSLPLFDTLSSNGSLPHVTYANLDMSVTFNCTTHHDGMKYVSIDPIFRVLDPFQPGATWQELSLTDFATKVLKMAPSSIKTTSTQVDKYRTADNLFVRMPVVTETWKTWRLAFICRANVDKSDVRRMGLPQYTLETRTNVEYYGWRIASSGSPKLRAVLGLAISVAVLPASLQATLTLL